MKITRKSFLQRALAFVGALFPWGRSNKDGKICTFVVEVMQSDEGVPIARIKAKDSSGEYEITVCNGKSVFPRDVLDKSCLYRPFTIGNFFHEVGTAMLWKCYPDDAPRWRDMGDGTKEFDGFAHHPFGNAVVEERDMLAFNAENVIDDSWWSELSSGSEASSAQIPVAKIVPTLPDAPA